jgi:hypothetical protein
MKIEITVEGVDKLEKFTKGTRRLANGLRGPLVSEFAGAVAKHTAVRGRANAPLDTERLRKGIRVTPVKRRGSTATTAVKIDDSIKYAIAMYVHLVPHGIPLRTSSATGRPVYSLDKTLVRLPSTVTRERGVGGMFIERAFFHNVKQYNQQLGNVLFALLKTGRKKRFRFRTR